MTTIDLEQWRLPDAVVLAKGAAVACAASVTVCLLRSARLRRSKPRPINPSQPSPGPFALPFLGNVLQLQSRYHETLYSFSEEPVSVYWVLSNPFVVVNDKDGLRRVLGGAGGLYAKPRYFGYRSRAVSSAVEAQRDAVAKESIAYDPNGDVSRAALDEAVREALPKIKSCAHKLLRTLEDVSIFSHQSREDSVMPIRRALVELNLDILFGVSSKEENAARVAAMIDFAGREFAQRMVNPLKVFVDWLANIRFFFCVWSLIGLGRRLCSTLDERASEERVTAGVSWVHAWVGRVGRIGKLGKVVGLLMASTQTVPVTATWMLHLVAHHPEVRKQVRKELENVGVSSIVDLDYDQLQSLPFTDAVVKEALRMYPPFPLIQRQAQEDDEIAGMHIPKGTIVYVVPWLVHRSDKFWKEPFTFRPERFTECSESHGDSPSDWTYLPFGRGSRMCAGSRLATTELKVILLHAVLGFEWTTTQPYGHREDNERFFPQLGMVPRGIRVNVRSGQKTKALDAIWTPLEHELHP